MKRFTVVFIITICVLLISNPAKTQSIQDRISKYGQDYVDGYLQPFADAFGAGMNSAWYNTANVDNGVSILAQAKIMLMPIPDDAKFFTDPVTGKPRPTFFGPDTGELNGINQKWAPLVVPHIAVGNFYDTRLMIRFLPKIPITDVGDLQLWGVGVQHNIGKYIPTPLPVDIAGMVAYQDLKVGSIVDFSSFTFGVQASKSIPMVDFYAGLSYESSKLKLSYTQTGGSPLSFTLTGKNNVRLTGGINFNLSVFKLNLDYSLAAQPVGTLGIGFGW